MRRTWDTLGIVDFFCSLCVVAFVGIRGVLIVAVPMGVLFVLAAMVKWAYGELF